MLLDANMKQSSKVTVSLVRSVHQAICHHGAETPMGQSFTKIYIPNCFQNLSAYHDFC